MKNFEYFTPTRVVFGKDTEQRTGELVKAQGCQKALVHFGGESAKKSGLLDRVLASLHKAGVAYEVLGGVIPNPRLATVYQGIDLCRKTGVDFILAVGGGSVIDSAKAIGYGVPYSGDVWDLYARRDTPKACLPIGAVLTIAASGSEMSNSSVITNENGGVKRSCNSNLARCRFAVMNPALTFTLPPYQTACGCVDILMHTLERYFSSEPSMELTDRIAEGLMRTVLHNAKLLLHDPQNYEARAEIMWAGSLSHNDLTGCGAISDGASHQLEHELSGMFDVAHGAGLAAVWGSWARYVYQTDSRRFAQLAVNVLGVPNRFRNQEKTALEGIAAMEEFFRMLSMPTNIRELGIRLTDDQINRLALKCSNQNTRTIGNFRVLDMEDIRNIYHLAKG